MPLAAVNDRRALATGVICAAMTAGQLWLSRLSHHSSYLAGLLPGILLTPLSIGLALPAAPVAITAGPRGTGLRIAISPHP